MKKALFQLKEFDIAIGSRKLSKDNKEKINLLRKILGGGWSVISNLILGYKIKDPVYILTETLLGSASL